MKPCTLYADNTKGFAPVFIYTTTESNPIDLLHGLETHPIDYPVYLDCKGKFAQLNFNILSKSKYNVFLLDDLNRIVLVGDPLHNSKLWELYKEVIQKLIENNGALDRQII